MRQQTLQCDLAGRCGGCPWIGLSVEEQRARRQADLSARLAGCALPAPPGPDWRSVYVSCAVESLTADIARLAGLGYGIEALVGVEPFPHTPHGEWVVRLSAQ